MFGPSENLHTQDGTTVDMEWFNENLNRQQYRQDLHDEKYHTDIYVLPKAKRLTHLVLHHCKYVSSLYAILDKVNLEGHLHRNADARLEVKRLALNGIIICMSMANICGKKLPGSFATMPWETKQAKDTLIETIGKMAKTIEDIDHMAQTNPIGELWNSAMMLFSVYVHCLKLSGVPFWEMVEAVDAHLLAVESKHMYHRFYLEQIDAKMGLYNKQLWTEKEKKECQTTMNA